MNKIKQKPKMKLIIGVVTVFLAAVITFGIVCASRIATISSLKKVSNDDFFSLDYKANYNLDKVIAAGVATTTELAQLASDTMLFGVSVETDAKGGYCSTFLSQTPEGEYIMGRNFDFADCAMALVKTSPKNGYKSISMVDLAFLSITKDNLPSESLTSKISMLLTPYICLDGINEKGVAVSVLNNAAGEINMNTEKTPIIITLAMRLILDKAANVEEALALLENYDLISPDDDAKHLVIADKSGKCVVVEYTDNQFVVLDEKICTNFTLTPNEFNLQGKGHDRYNIIKEKMEANNGILTEKEVMQTLSEARYVEDGAVTLWSAVYNLNKLTMDIAVHTDYSNIYNFSIE